MPLLRIDSSIKADGSHTREIAGIVEAGWREQNPGGEVVRRDLGHHPVPSDAWGPAVTANYVPAESRSPEQVAASALAAEAVDQLIAADALIITSPLYNFSVSQHLKAWIDLVITDKRMASGSEPALAGKPAVLVIARGGSYKAGTPREGWDHGTAWVLRILEDVWKLDVRVVETELTLAGVNPALAQFIDLANEYRAAAESAARDHASHLRARSTV